MNLEGIKKATLEIAYDNGMINRFCSREQILHNMDMVIKAVYLENKKLLSIDKFLNELDEESLNTLCCGEVTDIKKILKYAPNGTDYLLNEIFYNV